MDTHHSIPLVPYSTLVKYREILKLPDMQYNTAIDRQFLSLLLRDGKEVYCESFLIFGRNLEYDFTLLGGELEEDDENALAFLRTLQVTRPKLIEGLRSNPALIYARHGFVHIKGHPVCDKMFKLYRATAVEFPITSLN